MSIPIIFISGPTSIGKSKLAIRIAKEKNGEIINADSMQVYSELKILTARPTKADQKIAPHHLYGYVSGAHRYNVAEWCNSITSIIKKNLKNKKLSIIVGGTGLYIETLLNGLFSIPEIEEKYKKESNDLLKRLGKEKFYQEVHKLDKLSCNKISKNDLQRLKRIWEVYRATGETLYDWTQKNKKNFFNNYDYKIYLFFPNRDEIYKKVNSRFLRMIENGVVKEVKNLLSLNFDSSLPIMKAHGVPEITKYLQGAISLEECIAKAQQATRNYVKRQITWWRSSKLDHSSIFQQFPSDIDVNL